MFHQTFIANNTVFLNLTGEYYEERKRKDCAAYHSFLKPISNTLKEVEDVINTLKNITQLHCPLNILFSDPLRNTLGILRWWWLGSMLFPVKGKLSSQVPQFPTISCLEARQNFQWNSHWSLSSTYISLRNQNCQLQLFMDAQCSQSPKKFLPECIAYAYKFLLFVWKKGQ